MAVAPTGAIYKALKFDGVSSRTYGVYITGEAVYNAPERDVEMITIPGRNGSFALDNGRFQNIEVSYPAGIFAETEADFRQAISDFRNFLCSRNGYVRLQDEYNPDEYRMAVYKSGLEVDPAMLKAGEFTITFDCKPQRWLVSGETAVSVESGDTLNNPTLFESSPMLEVIGYGDIAINDDVVSVNGGTIGSVKICNRKYASDITCSVSIDDEFLNVGDQIFVSSNAPLGSQYVAICSMKFFVDSGTVGNIEQTPFYGDAGIASVNAATISAGGYVYTDCYFTPNSNIYYGTAISKSTSLTTTITTSDYGNVNMSCTYTLTYDGVKTLTIEALYTLEHFTLPFYMKNATIYENTGISSKPLSTDTLYIDLDIGEAYKIENGSVISINDGVLMPPNLPVLVSGSNVITFDNTYSDVKIIPRWWKI